MTFSERSGRSAARSSGNIGQVPGGPEQVAGLLLRAMGSAGQPASDLDSLFPRSLVHISFWAYVFLVSMASGAARRASGGCREGLTRCQDCL